MHVYKIKKILVYIFFITYSFYTYTQEKKDTLLTKSFDELFDFYNNSNSFEKSKLYIDVWLKKAKKENNISKLLTGYEIASLLYNNQSSLLYQDSILQYSLKNKIYDAYSASAYRMRGEYYYKKRNFKNELKNYLLAKDYADREGNPLLSFFIDYDIALIKDRNGEHEEALKIHKKNLLFAEKNIKKEYSFLYIQCIYALASSYNYSNKLDSASVYNKIGVKEAISLKENQSINFFTLNQGITHYFNKQCAVAIDSLSKASIHFEKQKDLPNSSESYYFLGKSYEKVGQIDLTRKYFNKVDTIFRKTNDLLPILRDTYYFLINDAQKNNNLKKQIDYTNQLIKLDSILYTNEIYISKNLIKEYDIPKLISSKENLIKTLKTKERKTKLLLVILLAITILITFIALFQYRKRNLDKKKFLKLIEETNQIIDTKETTNIVDVTNDNLNIPEEIVFDILDSLKKFENEKAFVNQGVTLQSLAKKINTNTNYLSKIINSYKKSNFSNYLNELRVNHAVFEMKNNPIYRKYTIKAISKEVGFSNAESFSRAFQKIKGIKPSYFLRELERHEKTTRNL